MSKKKNLTKAKKIRKQLLAASATGLLLVSSTANAGTSLVYAAETNQPTTAEKSTKNSETAATATASSSSAVSNSKTADEVDQINQATAKQSLDKSGDEFGKIQLATAAVNALFNGLVPKLTNTQEQIDDAKAKVNALANSDVKTALLARIASAQKVFDASVEAAKQATEQIRNDLNALYFRNNGNIDKTGLSSEATQSAFDALQQRINALSIDVPAMNQQKQALQKQLNDMKAMLQEIQLKASSGQVVAQLDTNPKGTYIRTFAGNVSGNATIGKIQITQPKYNSFMYLFNKEYQGGTYQNTVSDRINTTGRGGNKLIITTNEMPLAVNSNVQLSNTVSKEYTFKINDDGKWELSSSSYDAVQNAVNALFNGETPKPENTQEQIDQAKNQVNNLFDGADKNALLAKITKVQQAFDASTEEAGKTIEQIRKDLNALYFSNNGVIDKTGLSGDTTQGAFDALQQRINAL
ncbi:toxin Cry1Ac domain D-VI-related protein, partial [Enterococcus ratti]